MKMANAHLAINISRSHLPAFLLQEGNLDRERPGFSVGGVCLHGVTTLEQHVNTHPNVAALE